MLRTFYTIAFFLIMSTFTSTLSLADEIYMTCPSPERQFILGFDTAYKTIWSRYGIYVIFHKYQEQKNNDVLPLVVFHDEQKNVQYVADFRNKILTNINLPSAKPLFCH